MSTQSSSPREDVPVTPDALRARYESGATVDELVASSGLSYGTVLNRLHDAGTVMRTSWQTRRMRQDPQARQRLAAHLRTLYEKSCAYRDLRLSGYTSDLTRDDLSTLRLPDLMQAYGEVLSGRGPQDPSAR